MQSLETMPEYLPQVDFSFLVSHLIQVAVHALWAMRESALQEVLSY